MSAQTASTKVRRPGVINFIAAILFIQAAMAVIATISMTIWRAPILDFLEKENSPLSSGAFTGTIAGEAFLAILLFLVAAGLLRGSKGTRLFVTIVQGLTLAFAMYILVAHHVGGYMYRAVFSLFVGVFVLWALYTKESDEFFESEWP